MSLTAAVPDISWWETLGEDGRPVLLYGTGNGADKIIDACRHYGIALSGVFASDGFVRDREFHGMHVMSYSDAVSCFGDDMVILPAFGTSLPDVMERIAKLCQRHTVIVPEVPLYGGEIFDSAVLRRLSVRIDELGDSLADAMSRELLRDAIMFRMTGELGYLQRCEPAAESYGKLLGDFGILTALDGGAFRGDSATDMASALPGISCIIACEPDRRSYKKLSEFASDISGKCKVEALECALGDKCGEADYVSSGSRGSGRSGRGRRASTERIRVLTADSIAQNRRIDFIKLDVEGDEEAALDGARRIILRDRPALAVSLYHRTDDIVRLPEAVRALLPESKLFLRRPPCIPMWDLTLYAIPDRAQFI